MTSSALPAPPPANPARLPLVVGAVIGAHAAALWALNSGFMHRVPEVIKTPEPLMVQLVTPPPAPAIKPPEVKPVAPLPPVRPAKPKPAPPPPKPRPAPPKPRPAPPKPAPAPQPLAVEQAADTAMSVPAPAPAEPVAPPAPPTPAPAPPAPPAPPAAPKMTQPSSSASHLSNPAPEYPSISRRMGEEGRVMLRVFVSADGRAEQVELAKSSGYDRLDQAAIRAVRQWRFKPGTQDGEPKGMWFNQPINFVLNQ